METPKLKDLIIKTIQEQLNSMSNLSVPYQLGTGWDNNQADPKYFLGFPVIQPEDNDATINPLTRNPNDIPQNGTYRFYVDTTPRFRIWAYLVYKNSSAVLIGGWKSITLT